MFVAREPSRSRLAARFTSILAALGSGERDGRVVPMVRALADLGHLDVDAVTVGPPEASENGRRWVGGRGWPAHPQVVADDEAGASAIVDRLDHDEALAVMSTSATRSILGHGGPDLARRVLALTARPVLLIGPQVPGDARMDEPTLIIATDSTDRATLAIPAVVSWVNTFPGGRPCVAEVVATVADRRRDPIDGAHGQALADRLGRAGVPASARLLHGGDPVTWLEEFAEDVTDAVFVATSSRWSDPRSHRSSTTRRLVQRSTHPVLVVPDHRRPPRRSSARRA
jgi:nucleotide-binding universal stress UspA family protein